MTTQPVLVLELFNAQVQYTVPSRCRVASPRGLSLEVL